MPTRFNEAVSTSIRNTLLFALESFSYKVQKVSIDNEDTIKFIDDSLADLRKFVAGLSQSLAYGKTIFGFPLKFDNLNIGRILEEIEET